MSDHFSVKSHANDAEHVYILDLIIKHAVGFCIY